jgi:hypothetical protein
MTIRQRLYRFLKTEKNKKKTISPRNWYGKCKSCKYCHTNSCKYSHWNCSWSPLNPVSGRIAGNSHTLITLVIWNVKTTTNICRFSSKQAGQQIGRTPYYPKHWFVSCGRQLFVISRWYESPLSYSEAFAYHTSRTSGCEIKSTYIRTVSTIPGTDASCAQSPPCCRLRVAFPTVRNILWHEKSTA